MLTTRLVDLPEEDFGRLLSDLRSAIIPVLNQYGISGSVEGSYSFEMALEDEAYIGRLRCVPKLPKGEKA